VREHAPGFTFMAEVYWDLEWTLQQQGFDYTYDKRLYDRLRDGHARPVREHFHAGLDYQDSSAEAQRVSMVKSNSFNRSMACGVLLLNAILLGGCEGLAVHHVSSLLVPEFQRSEVIGFVAGFGTTFAAVPDLLGMFRRRSSKGINPTMAGIIGVFQIVWIYYGLLIGSRPVIAWNMIGVVINLLTVAAYLRFARREDRATV
jgi:uncharacterized protein with PQ loop repeat